MGGRGKKEEDGAFEGRFDTPINTMLVKKAIHFIVLGTFVK